MSTPVLPRGVHKVSEQIAQLGRALIITEEDDSKLDWSKIPDGTLKVNPKTGLMSVKLEGETSWVPAGLKNDGTIAIAKDSRINLEVFTITAINGDGTFIYTNTEGLNRTKNLTSSGKPMFELEKGTYINKRNALEVFVNNDKYTSTSDGSLVEVDEMRFSMATSYSVGTKFTARYIQRFNIGNPYPRFYMSDTEPAIKEYGDLWIDTSGKDDNGIDINTNDGPVLKWWDGTAKWHLINDVRIATDVILGGVKVKAYLTSNIKLEADGEIWIPNATSANRGVIKTGDVKLTHTQMVTDGTISVPIATSPERGVVKTGDVTVTHTKVATDGTISVPIAGDTPIERGVIYVEPYVTSNLDLDNATGKLEVREATGTDFGVVKTGTPSTTFIENVNGAINVQKATNYKFGAITAGYGLNISTDGVMDIHSFKIGATSPGHLENRVWFDTTEKTIKVSLSGAWVTFGAIFL